MGPDNQETARLVSDVERAVDFITTNDRADFVRLVEDLKSALSANDQRKLLATSKDIADRATNRFAAVVETADRLHRHLGG